MSSTPPFISLISSRLQLFHRVMVELAISLKQSLVAFFFVPIEGDSTKTQ